MHFGFAHDPAGGAGAGVVVVGAGAGADVVDGAGACAGDGVAWPELEPDAPSVRESSDCRDAFASFAAALPEPPLLLTMGPSGAAEQATITSVAAASKKTRTFTNQQPACLLERWEFPQRTACPPSGDGGSAIRPGRSPSHTARTRTPWARPTKN